ncbi:MAG: hypothetical protein II039_00180, partial [Treponema sp.]|nr:hypothetical protein [Treponema sp.]
MFNIDYLFVIKGVTDCKAFLACRQSQKLKNPAGLATGFCGKERRAELAAVGKKIRQMNSPGFICMSL